MILRQDEVMGALVNRYYTREVTPDLIRTLVRQAYEEGVRDGYNAVYDSAVLREIEKYFEMELA